MNVAAVKFPSPVESRPKLLFFSTQLTYPFWGGSEKFWYEALLDVRLREQFDCHVMLRESPVTRERGEQLKALGVRVVANTINENGVAMPHVAAPGAVRRIGRGIKRVMQPERGLWLKALDRHHPDLVWFNLADASCASTLAAAAAVCHQRGVPYWLIVQHAFEHYFLSNDDHTERFAAVVEGARRVVCISQRNRAAVERIIGCRLSNVWMTTNALTHEFMERASAVSQTQPVRVQGRARLLNLARFDPKFKGQHILFEALADACWRARDWSLVMQGWGSLGALFGRLLKYYDLPAERVQVAGFTADVLPVIAASDLLVMPSLSEGTPFAVTEAMACARPAVGTPVGGIPELIIEGQTGWLSRSTEVADVADALERAWAAREQWPTCGAKARAHVATTYDQQRTIPDLVAALREDTTLQKSRSA